MIRLSCNAHSKRFAIPAFFVPKQLGMFDDCACGQQGADGRLKFFCSTAEKLIFFHPLIICNLSDRRVGHNVFPLLWEWNR